MAVSTFRIFKRRAHPGPLIKVVAFIVVQVTAKLTIFVPQVNRSGAGSQESCYFTSVEPSRLTKSSKMTLEVMTIAQGSDDRRRKWKLPKHLSGKCMKRCSTIKKYRFGK